MKKLVLILLFSVFVLALSAGGALFFLSAPSLKKTLNSVPFLNTYSGQLLKLRNELFLILIPSSSEDNGRFSFAGIQISYGTPKVTIDLQPLRDTLAKSLKNNDSIPQDQSPENAKSPDQATIAPPISLDPEGSDPATNDIPKSISPETEAPVKKPKANIEVSAPEPVPQTPAKTSAPKVIKDAKKQASSLSQPSGSGTNLSKAENPTPKASKSEDKQKAKIKKNSKEPKLKPDSKGGNKQNKIAPPPSAPEAKDGKKEHKLGLTYYKGEGVEKNFELAQKWFQKAAKSGHSSAQYNLGIMSYLGQGITKDYGKAAEWFRVAANQDHALAQYNLGFLYFEGKGVKKDNLQAFMWIDRAASQGDKKAIKALEALEKVLPKEIYKKKK